MTMKIKLVPVEPEHERFLYELYADVREEEVAAFGWGQAERDAFLRMQFELQRKSYAMRYPKANHRIVSVEGQPKGRMIVDEEAADIRLVDLSLLASSRNRGIGSTLIAGLQDEARRTNRPLRLSSLQTNPAVELYRRLGFEIEGAQAPYFSLIWLPD